MTNMNQDLPEVTVIVPVYNSGKYLDQCLESLKSQSLDKNSLEVLIINDGSTDGSTNIIKKYVSTNTNFRSIEQENAGLFSARKTGIENAKGRFIGWVDSDDFVDPSMFEELLKIAKKNNSDLVYCNYDFYPKKIGTKSKWFREYKGHKNIRYVERNSQPWNKLVSKDLLDRLGIANLFLRCFDEAYIKCLLYAKNPISVNEIFYHYRVGSKSMSSSYTNVSHYKKFIQSSKNLQSEMKEISNKNPYWKEYFNFRVLYYELLTLIIAANAEDKTVFLKLRKQRKLFNKNKHFRSIMIDDYGFIKYFVMVKILPLNYGLSSVICKLVFH